MRDAINTFLAGIGALSGWLALSALLVWVMTSQADIFQDRFEVRPPPDTRVITGVAVKGPFVSGSSVTVRGRALDLTDAQQTFADVVSDDFGRFTVEAAAGLEVLDIQVSGHFFNELTLETTDATGDTGLTLSALTRQPHNAQVTVLTSLERPRVEALVGQGVPFRMAKRQALDEWYALFGMRPERRDAADIDVTSADAPVLLTLTALLMTRSDGEAREPGALLSWIDLFASEFARHQGELPSALMAELLSASAVVDPLEFRAALDVALMSEDVPDFAPALSAFQQRNGHRIRLTTEGPGAFNGPNERWVPKGQPATITASPARGHGLAEVSGSCDAGQVDTTNPRVWQTGPISADCELTLRFAPNDYTLSLDLNGGSLDQHFMTATFGAPIGPLPTPTREGHAFLGWKPLGGDQLWDAGTIYERTRSTTLTAQWAAKTYTLKFDADQGSSVDDIELAFGSVITAPEDPEREGWAFAGWSPELPTTMPAEDLLFTAQWTPVLQFCVVLIAGQSAVLTEVVFDEVLPAIEAPERPGFRFQGYRLVEAQTNNQEPQLGDRYYDAAMNPLRVWDLTENPLLDPDQAPLEACPADGETPDVIPFRLLAEFEPKRIVVDLDQSGGEGGTKQVDVLMGGRLPDITVPVRDGYAFMGYALSEQGEQTSGSFIYGAPGEHLEGQIWQQPEDTTLYAWWNVQKFRLTFEVNGGTVPLTTGGQGFTSGGCGGFPPPSGSALRNLQLCFDTDQPIAVPDDPTRAGYAFGGWAPEPPDVMPPEDLILFAQWLPAQHNIDIDLNCPGVDPLSLSVTFDAPMPDLVLPGGTNALPQCPGLLFGDIRDGDGFTHYANIDQELRVTAAWRGNDGDVLHTTWSPDVFLLTLDPDGGQLPSGPNQFNVFFQADLPAFPSPTRVGHDFEGWFTEPDGAGVKVEGGAESWFTEDSTLYAHWTPLTYTLTLDPQGGALAGSDEHSVVFGEPLLDNVPDDEPPTRTGFEFAGWSLTAGGAVIDDQHTHEQPGNITLFAQWTPRTFEVSFGLQGGSSDVNTDFSPVEATFGQLMPSIGSAAPTRSGQVFTGFWETKEGSGVQFYDAGLQPISAWTSPSDGTIYAGWQAGVFTLTFDSAGGSAVAAITQASDTTITPPADPTRTGHKFDKWDPPLPEKMPSEDQSFTAQWDVQSYTLSFDSAGGTEISNIQLDFGAEITRPADPTRTGYTFADWHPPLPEEMPGEDQSFTARWTADVWMIDLDRNGGKGGDSSVQVSFGSFSPTISPPSLEGHEFEGYFSGDVRYIDQEGGGVLRFNNIELEELVAQWKVNEYTLSFDSAQGSAVDDITQDFDTAIVPPTDPERGNASFAGWSPKIPATMPANDLTVVAQWNATLTFNSNNGTPVDPITQRVGTRITAPAPPTRDGYQFDGWDPALDVIADGNSFHMAQWAANTYTLTLDRQGGSGGSTQATATFDAAWPSGLRAPVRTGFIFEGYFDQPGGQGTLHYDADMEVVVFGQWSSQADVTLFAHWTPRQFTLSFDSAEGSAVDAITQDVGTTITPPASPTRTGHRFTGWQPDVPATMPASDLTLTAQWELQVVTLTFKDDDGTVLETRSQDFGTSVQPPPVPERPGFSATWNPPPPANMPAADASFTAQYTAVPIELTPRVTPAEGGSLSLSATTLQGGETTNASISPNQGYELAELLVCGQPVEVLSAGGSVELGPFGSACVVEARFELRNFCSADLCLNGGTCINLPFEETYQCDCAAGFTGGNCESIDACEVYGDPCGNGTCVSFDGGIRCECSGSAACSCCTGINLLPCSNQGLGSTGDFCVTPRQVSDALESTALSDAIEQLLLAGQGGAAALQRPLASPISIH